MLERATRIAIIVIACCLSFNLLRDVYGIFAGTAAAQSQYSVPVVLACAPLRDCRPASRLPAVPVVQFGYPQP
jgi:hypothetical protein